MTSRAYAIRTSMIQREEGVVLGWQRRRNPRGGGMARGARGRPAGTHVVRIRRRSEIRFVARVAVGRRASEHVVDVTLIARYVHMRTRQGKRGVVVIEGRARPRSCCVAGIAGRGEASGRMIRVVRSVPVRLVAPVTRCGQGCVVVVRVALQALQRRVRSSQRESRVVVVEGRRAPSTCRVADRAVSRKTRGHVVGISRSAEIRLVTRVTRSRSRRVIVICVALDARQCGM